MIYQFGTQHQATGGPRYVVAGGSTIKYMDRPRAAKISVDAHWLVPSNMNIAAFDWTWHPDDRDPPYRYQFPTQWNRAGGPEYQTPGAQHIKFVTVQQARMLPATDRWHIPPDIDINSFDFSWIPDPTEPPYRYQFGTQWQKTGGPTYTVPGGEEIKYINAPRSRKIHRDDHWEIPSGADIESFDWTWHPDSTDAPYIYEFGTQHQRTGGPRYVIPGATEIKYVDQIRIKTQQVATAIIEIDHLDGNAGKITDTARTSRYFDNYLDTLRRIAKNIGTDHEFVWICSSICDYTDFDFSWHPEQWQAGMLHVFPSGDQKFGDTFFMHVPTFQYRADTCQLLEWYDVNFITHTSVPRNSMPVIQHDDDSHVEPIKTSSWSGPLALFTNRSVDQSLLPVVPLWREKTKTVVPLDAGACSIIVPRAAVPYVKTQVYDYPYIDKTHKNIFVPEQQDIVFISYDEPQAQENWQLLSNKFPRAHHVAGVSGMEKALIAAARVSTTPWYFAVFAKTELADTFNFSFVPNYMQQPKHYIFDCKNMVNGLTYGHMGVVLYNVRYILLDKQYEDLDLDYTLSFPHEVVPELSCLGKFDSTAYHTWRTAFRECAKLCLYESREPSVETQYRLQIWQSKAQGPHAEWCLKGAKDGVEFFNETQGDLSLLKQSFRWQWLRDRFIGCYGEID